MSNYLAGCAAVEQRPVVVEGSINVANECSFELRFACDARK